MEDRWIVAQTQSRREAFAGEALREAGFPIYLPRIQVEIAGRKRIVPMFPSYVFVLVRQSWSGVMRTTGVIKVIRNGDEPARLDHNIVTQLQGREKDGIVQLPPLPMPRRPNKARILSGPFAGKIAGLVDGLSSTARQRVLLEILGRKTIVEVARTELEPLFDDGRSRRRRTRNILRKPLDGDTDIA